MKRYKTRILLFTLFSILSPLFFSCGNNGCEEVRETFCLADMREVSGAKISRLYAYGLGQAKGEADSLGVNSDEVMLSENSPKTLELILNPDSSVTDIRLQMTVTIDNEQSQIEDTLHFEYDANPYFLDMECGCSMYFYLKEVTTTHHFLQNLTLHRQEITNEPNINIIIEY